MDLRSILHTAAPNAQLYDETDGVFGELIHPEMVVSSIRHHSVADDLVGRIDRGATAPSVEIRSQTYTPTTYRDSGGREVTTDEVSIEIDNTSSLWVKVRWIDENWSNPPTHVWTIEPASTWTQFAKVGHLFVLSLVNGASDLFESSTETVLGAFRPTKRLPSGLPHCLLVQGEGSLSPCDCVLEVMLMDESKSDALCIAASSLDHEIVSSRVRALATLSTLKKIVSNVIHHPTDDKFRKLRLSNQKIERTISSSMGAMDFLQILGFSMVEQPGEGVDATTGRESADSPGERPSVRETFLVLPQPSGKSIERLQKAADFLGMLSQHADPSHKSELSLPVPWQAAMRASGSGSSNWNGEGTHFLTGDDRWERVERASRLRRSGGGRPPAPGNAPSSRGSWGR